MNYNEMTDYELANIMVNYINRLEHLMEMIAEYLNGNDSIPTKHIKREYAKLKSELHEDAKELALKRNYIGSKVFMGAFSPSIRESSAFGFTVFTNSVVSQMMYDAVSEAYYKLTKYLSLEQWGKLM